MREGPDIARIAALVADPARSAMLIALMDGFWPLGFITAGVVSYFVLPAFGWRTEFALLELLMNNPRRVLSKAQILDRVWNYDFGGQANVVELYISYLRKKIDAGRAPMIHTMRGAGYVLKPAG